ncbi:3-hydroxyacyl-CoA dehydrogenase NAD-binding domain-containing protein [Oricola nitratireducens]|uniref:3-hydroxyacyl-CoA dehydrogenase NAD-binding domain-containing protein n=1 Tax=Oricola nitratireducens TaxID=2775868 RepID=UPI00186630D3|nr:3-hydroxyacyl-CoA dehydrogenase NAD-binding domain-containing protein [Oricola nitratireducens]
MTRQDSIAVVTTDSPPVNALSVHVRNGLKSAIEDADRDDSVEAVVVICNGRTFFAGADITELGKPPLSPDLPEVLAAIEKSAKPVIAAIHGTALGGGLELALACHYRIAVPSARVGLPEVKLGLLPGASGTQRLPRLIDPGEALDLMISGDPVDAEKALRTGMIDTLAEGQSLEADAVAFAKRIVGDAKPLRRIRDMPAKTPDALTPAEFAEAYRERNARKLRNFRAPDEIIRCVEAAMTLPFDEGLAIERKLFRELLDDPQSAAMRYAFFAERKAAKVPGVEGKPDISRIRSIGIVGAGTMGTGIGMAFVNAGYPVTIVETQQAALDRGLANIRRTYERSAQRGSLTPEEAERRTALFFGRLELEALSDCDLIVEAAFEEMSVKTEVFFALDRIAKPSAILATNTSYLDIDRIAATTSRPQSVLGMHFFSPANIMRLVEIVRGEKTDLEIVGTAMALARAIGKVGVVVGVCHGFVGNRMLEKRQDEADRLILEGATPWAVDRVLYDFGLPMGPFAMADLAGLDLGWTREASTGETVRDRLCESERRGQKTGAGYYDYGENRKSDPSPLVEEIIRDVAKARGIARREISDEEILDRLLLPMINEGANILEEGKALRASDIDVIWINGYGWPAYRGGPMFHAEQVGLDKVVERLRALEAAHGGRFRPAALLQRLAAEGSSLTDDT